MPYISSFQRLGRQEGLQKGLQEGLENMLRIQLEKRFGTLPPSVRARLKKAAPSELREWGTAVLDAPTLDSVFARH